MFLWRAALFLHVNFFNTILRFACSREKVFRKKKCEKKEKKVLHMVWYGEMLHLNQLKEVIRFLSRFHSYNKAIIIRDLTIRRNLRGWACLINNVKMETQTHSFYRLFTKQNCIWMCPLLYLNNLGYWFFNFILCFIIHADHKTNILIN